MPMPTPTVPEALDTGVDPSAIATTPPPEKPMPKRKLTRPEIAIRMKKAGQDTKGYAKGGKVSSASKRADGCAVKGKTRGKMV